MIGSYAGTIGSMVVMFVMVCFEGHCDRKLCRYYRLYGSYVCDGVF